MEYIGVLWRHGVLVDVSGQFHLMKSGFRFCAGSNHYSRRVGRLKVRTSDTRPHSPIVRTPSPLFKGSAPLFKGSCGGGEGGGRGRGRGEGEEYGAGAGLLKKRGGSWHFSFLIFLRFIIFTFKNYFTKSSLAVGLS